jgi:uncharacterized protein
MNRVVHFEIHADKPERAIEFYKKVFGWKFEKWGGASMEGMAYWIVTTGPDKEEGINGGLMKREKPVKGDSIIAYVCTMHVKSLEGALKKITAAGGKIVMGKMPIPGMGWYAYCKDTEKNKFGVMEYDKSAK